MTMKKCPQCRSEALRYTGDEGTCCDCNFNTKAGYAWGLSHNPKAALRRDARILGLPIYPSDLNRAASAWLKVIRFGKTDRRILLKHLWSLSPFARSVVFLRFWKNLSPAEIGNRFDLPTESIEGTLNKSFQALRDLCLADPEFSLHGVQSALPA